MAFYRGVRFGARMSALADVLGSQVSFPDRDLRTNDGARIEGSGVVQSAKFNGRARYVALSYDTDWDLVRIVPRGVDASEYLLLGPGLVLELPDCDGFDAYPHVNAPSTRLYDATATAGDLNPLFYGTLRLDVWTEGSCPHPDYVPRLAPMRTITLAAIALANTGAPPTVPVVTVPAINVQRAQWLGQNSASGGGAIVYAALVQARAEAWIDQAEGAADTDPQTGLTYVAIGVSSAGAAFLDEPTAPFAKLLLGANAVVTVPKGSVLSLYRRVC